MTDNKTMIEVTLFSFVKVAQPIRGERLQFQIILPARQVRQVGIREGDLLKITVSRIEQFEIDK